MSIAYVAGFIVGVLCVALVFTIIGIIWRKKHGTKYGTYDERQILARGSAYKTGFFILMTYEVLTGMISLATGWQLFADEFTGSCIGIIIAATAFAVQCIVKDAYCSLSENAKSVTILFLAIAGLNMAVAVWNIKDGESFLTDGRLNFHSLNLLVVVMMFVIAIANLVKMQDDKKEAGE